MTEQEQLTKIIGNTWLVDFEGNTHDVEEVLDNVEINSIARELLEQGYRKLPENSVVIDKNENPCLSCPVPEDIQRNVDCSTICGAVRLGIDWQNQCKVLVKENKQLIKAIKETIEKIYTKIKDSFLMDSENSYKLKLWLEEEFGVEINYRTKK